MHGVSSNERVNNQGSGTFATLKIFLSIVSLRKSDPGWTGVGRGGQLTSRLLRLIGVDSWGTGVDSWGDRKGDQAGSRQPIPRCKSGFYDPKLSIFFRLHRAPLPPLLLSIFLT